MRFKFPCPHCSATLNAQDEWRGRKATCKSCGKKLVVPLLESSRLDEVDSRTESSAENHSEQLQSSAADGSIADGVVSNSSASNSSASNSSVAEGQSRVADSTIEGIGSAASNPIEAQQAEFTDAQTEQVADEQVAAAQVVASNTIAKVPSEIVEISNMKSVDNVEDARANANSLGKTVSAEDLFDFAADSPITEVIGNAATVEHTEVGSQQQTFTPAAASSVKSATASIANVEVDREVVLSSIHGSIEPVQTTLMYRLAVIPVALLMIILPLVYIALIAGVGYFTCWYAVKGLSVFEGVNPSGGGGRSRGMGAVLMYAAPLFASALTFIFLIKPLFARTKRSTAQVAIKPEEQPVLFAFVEQIAKAVHAPKPTSIVIDTEVNASASFRRGWLSLFRRGDLELTIGLPLAQRLTAQELAGVLAHEFGHFSQGLGMRLQYIVRSINMWFAQVVYQRDRADQWLANSAKELDIRLALVVYFTMFMIWLSRRVLWVLMMIGHGFSSILLRQMEYDADQHEIRLAGSDRFISTAKKLPRLSVAYQESGMQMQHAFADERLVNHLPALVGVNYDQQSAEILQKLDEHSATEKSSWFDTHPLNRDRIARAEQSASGGIMSLDIPACHLFREYDELAKHVTRQFYIEIFEGEFKDSMLTDIDQVQALMESSKADYEARVKLLGEEFALVRPIPLASPADRREDFQQLLTKMEQISKAMTENEGEFKSNCKSLEELERRWITAYQALSFQSCGITFKEKIWEGVPVDSAASIQRAADQTQIELGQLHERLSRFEKLLGARVDTAIQCLWSIKDCDQFLASEVRERMFKALNTLASQFKCQQEYVSLKRDFSVVAGIFAVADFGNLSKPQRAEVDKHIERLKEFAARICHHVQSTAYPFDHSRGEITLSQYLAPSGLKLVDMASTCETSASILQNFDSAYIRSVGVLCEGVLRTEEFLSKVPLESLLQDKAALSQIPETNSSISFSSSPATIGAMVDAAEIIDSAEVIEIKSDAASDTSLFEFPNAISSSAPAPVYASPTPASSTASLVTATPKKSRRWIWVLGIGATLLVLLGGGAAVVVMAGKYLAGGAKPKAYTKPTVAPSDIVHSTQRNLLYLWNTELPVSYELLIEQKKNPNAPIARGTVSFTELANSNADAKDPTEFSTGFLIDGGLVATTASSVLGSSQIAVFDTVRKQFISASILAVDTEKNVALLTTQLAGPTALKLASSGTVSSEATVNVLSLSGTGEPNVAMPTQLSTKANTMIAASSGEAPKLKQPMLDSDIGSPIVDSQGLVVGIVDIPQSSGEQNTDGNAKVITCKEILDLLSFCKIDIGRSGGRAWSNSSSPVQPVVRVRSYQKYPFKRVKASVNIVHSSSNQTENFIGSLTVSQLGQLRASSMSDSSPPGMPLFAEMVFVPLNSMNQTEWTIQTAGERSISQARNIFGRPSSPSAIYRKQNAKYKVTNRDGDRVQIEGDIETELGPADNPNITIKQHTNCEFNLELGIPETVRHEFERREAKSRPLDWIVTLKRVVNAEK